MSSILLIIQFSLAVVLTIVILLQKSSSIGLGAYSGSNESVFGAKGPAGFLTKLTFTLGLAFVINTLALGYVYNEQNKGSIIDSVDTTKIPAAPISPAAPAAPLVPSAPVSK